VRYDPSNVGFWPYLFPLVFIALAIFRNSRERKLVVERLWLMPTVILAMTGLAFSQQAMPTIIGIAMDAAALLIGAALGFWRGRLTNITVDPATHVLTSKASPAGMIFILAIFALRLGLRAYAGASASVLHASITEITDAFLLMAVGLVCTQRIEIFIRARRLLETARSAS
jgi:hypothetical protein